MNQNKFKVFWGVTSLAYFVGMPFKLKEKTPPVGTHLVRAVMAPIGVITVAGIVAVDFTCFIGSAMVSELNHLDNSVRGKITEPFKYSGLCFNFSGDKGLTLAPWEVDYGDSGSIVRISTGGDSKKEAK